MEIKNIVHTTFRLEYITKRVTNSCEERIALFLLILHKSIENDASNIISIVMHVFIAAVTFIQSLPSSDKEIHIQTDRLIGMGSRARICIPSLINIGSGHLKLKRLIHRDTHTYSQTHRRHGNYISSFSSFKSKNYA